MFLFFVKWQTMTNLCTWVNTTIVVTSWSALWMRVSIQNFDTEGATHAATEGNIVIEHTPVLYPRKLSPGVWLTLQLQSVPIRICFCTNAQCEMFLQAGELLNKIFGYCSREGATRVKKRERKKQNAWHAYSMEQTFERLCCWVHCQFSAVWVTSTSGYEVTQKKQKIWYDMSSDRAQSTDGRST